jgi:glyoxylase-like metal-dependent hydrolase (beta-lactamase superfamily II)
VKVHHLNCGSFCPLLGAGAEAVTHCLLIETARSGLILVDTGIGHAVAARPAAKMSWMNRVTLRPRFDTAVSALARVQALGYASADVRHIVVTHLDVDHAGGLQDFPAARVHVHAQEFSDATRARPGPRYSPSLFAHGVHFETYSEGGDDWFGFASVRALRGLPPEVALVPLSGHTRGHTGVAVQGDDGWLLHAGDAYIDPLEVTETPVSWQSRFAAWLTADDPKARRANVERLRSLSRVAPEVRCFCSHSAGEFDECRRRRENLGEA